MILPTKRRLPRLGLIARLLLWIPLLIAMAGGLPLKARRHGQTTPYWASSSPTVRASNAQSTVLECIEPSRRLLVGRMFGLAHMAWLILAIVYFARPRVGAIAGELLLAVAFLCGLGTMMSPDGWASPQLLLNGLLLLASFHLMRAAFSFRVVLAAGICPTCGYDMRATPGRCPECGRVASAGATVARL